MQRQAYNTLERQPTRKRYTQCTPLLFQPAATQSIESTVIQAHHSRSSGCSPPLNSKAKHPDTGVLPWGGGRGGGGLKARMLQKMMSLSHYPFEDHQLVFKFRTFCYPALRFGEGLSKRMHQINATPGIQHSGTPTNQKEVHTVHTTSLPASCNPEHRKHGDTGTSQ